MGTATAELLGVPCVTAATKLEIANGKGTARREIEGAGEIARLVRQSAGRVAVMAGGGVREATVAELVRRSGVGEVHVRGTRVVSVATAGSGRAAIRLRKPFPEDEGAWEETDESRIRAFVALANGTAPMPS